MIWLALVGLLGALLLLLAFLGIRSFDTTKDAFRSMMDDLKIRNQSHHIELNHLIERRFAQQDHQISQFVELEKKILKLYRTLSHDGQRGAFGETQLQHVLEDLFAPDQIMMQHTLSNQRRVDAALWLAPIKRWLCIDAKFPFEDFSPDPTPEELTRFKTKLKKHIKDIADRYHIPGETVEPVLLFLPAEGLFLWLHDHAYELFAYAQQLRIWITSPSTLPSVLHMVLALMHHHRLDQTSMLFARHFEKILALQNSVYEQTHALEKQLNQQQQKLWKLIQEQKKLDALLKSIHAGRDHDWEAE